MTRDLRELRALGVAEGGFLPVVQAVMEREIRLDN